MNSVIRCASCEDASSTYALDFMSRFLSTISFLEAKIVDGKN